MPPQNKTDLVFAKEHLERIAFVAENIRNNIGNVSVQSVDPTTVDISITKWLKSLYIKYQSHHLKSAIILSSEQRKNQNFYLFTIA